MSPFYPFRGGFPKGDNVTFFYRFFMSGLPLLAVQVRSVVAVPCGDGLAEKTNSEVNPETSTEAKRSCRVLTRLVANNPCVNHSCCFLLWSHLDAAHVGPEESIPLSSWPNPLVHLKKGPNVYDLT